MKRLLNLIERDIKKNMLTKIEYIKEFNRKEYVRETYIDGKIFMENKIDLVFLIDTGDWFYKTIRFDITINENDNYLMVRKGYGLEYTKYKKSEYKEVEKYIKYEIMKFRLKDKNLWIKNKDINLKETKIKQII